MLNTLALLAQANEQTTDTILWVIAAVLVIAGIFAIIRSQVDLGHRADHRGAARRARWSQLAGLATKRIGT